MLYNLIGIDFAAVTHLQYHLLAAPNNSFPFILISVSFCLSLSLHTIVSRTSGAQAAKSSVKLEYS